MMNVKRNELPSLLHNTTSDLFQHRQMGAHAPIFYAAIKPHQVLNI